MKELRITRLLVALLVVLTAVALNGTIRAEEKSAQDVGELAKKSQNPISDLISLPFQNNSNFDVGPKDAYTNVLNIQPVYPVKVSENWNLINRAIIPVIYEGEVVKDEGTEFGLGDFTYQGFVSPRKAEKFIWGIGPQLGLPTGTGRLSSNQWTLGPAVVGLVMPGPWVVGLLVSNVWNIGDGYDEAQSVNFFSAQYFVNYNMKGGWFLSSSPIITANWQEEGDDRWTVPFGAGVGRVFRIGKQPVNVKLQGLWNAVRPDGAPDWTLQFQFTFLFPK